MEELKPCPFCGGKAKIYATTTRTYPNHAKHYCYCEECLASGQSFSDFKMTEAAFSKQLKHGTGGLTMEKLKPCPFCGCSMEIEEDNYPNGDARIEPYGWHDDDCTLNHVLWCFDAEDDGWTAETIAESWNVRAE